MAVVITGSRAEVLLQPGKISMFRLAHAGAVTAATVTSALGYTPENPANKNVSNGYAGLKAPSINTSQAGGKTTHGIATGHIRIGQPSDGIDAFVGLYHSEYYQDVEQEVRGVTVDVFNTRTTGHPDEPTLGWDFIAGSFSAVVSQYNQIANIVGTHKGVVGEVIAQNASTSYTVLKSYSFQATAIVGANAVLTEHCGMVIGTPIREENLALAVPSSRIGTGYGLRIQDQVGSVASAAIKLDGSGDGGRIKWTGVSIAEDGGGKLEFDFNSTHASFVNPLTATSASSGGASALPGAPAGYWRVVIGGTGRKIPFWAD